MGAPSMSIVVNELVQVGIRTIIRIGTSGSIQDHVRVGSVVIGSGALTNQGAADDIAPPQYPASADPFLTVALADAAARQGHRPPRGHHGLGRHLLRGPGALASSANPHLQRRCGAWSTSTPRSACSTSRWRPGTLFKMGNVYGFHAGCVCGIIAQRTEDERPDLTQKDAAVDRAIAVAVAAADAWDR
jgi:uridine phosphorylase